MSRAHMRVWTTQIACSGRVMLSFAVSCNAWLCSVMPCVWEVVVMKKWSSLHIFTLHHHTLALFFSNSPFLLSLFSSASPDKCVASAEPFQDSPSERQQGERRRKRKGKLSMENCLCFVDVTIEKTCKHSSVISHSQSLIQCVQKY